MTKRHAFSEFLTAAAERPMQWGVSDCSMWIASWVQQRTGLALDLPAYSSRAEAQALIDNAGGLANLWSDIADAAGLSETTSPEMGDVGVMHLPRGDVGVICGHYGYLHWRAEQMGCVRFLPRTSLVKAWSIP